MLEQAKRNSPVYLSREVIENHKSKLISKSIAIPHIKFGPAIPIVIHRLLTTTKTLVEIVHGDAPNFYIYDEQGQFIQRAELTEADTINDELYSYFYGLAHVDGFETPYLIQNNPPVSINQKPDMDTFELPPLLSGYPYQDMKFHYMDELINLFGDLTATYTDRYKRPLNPEAVKVKKFYPTSMDKVKTTFAEVANTPYPYPIVIQLTSSHNQRFACVDLEPTHTDEDAKLAESFDAFYVEDTPRGGKHYIVRVPLSDDTFKYRLSDNLEVQVNCQITFYGINGQWLNDNPSESDFSQYKVVGHHTTEIETMTMPSNVDDIIQECIVANDRLGSTGREQAERVYITDSDESHADFVAILRLYNIDIKPFKTMIDKESLPWVLAGYASHYIPARAKHATERNGVPYLVYLSNIIINQRN